MKKLTLLVAMAACGMGAANAQYVVDPSLDKTINNGDVFDVFQLDAASVSRLQAAGKTVHEYTIDNVTRNLWLWDGTFEADESAGIFPGVDMHMDGYTAVKVTTVGWSGAGLTISEGSEIDLKHISDDTRFHMGLRTTNAPASVAIIFGDGTNADTNTKWSPAKFSVGSTAFNDNGAIYPLVGNFDAGGDWVAVDLSLADMKKLFPSFSYAPCNFNGNIYSFLAGGVTGTNLCIDAVYLYGSNGGSVEGVAADEAQIVVSSKTISVLGGTEGIELYNIAGQLVKKTASTIMGTEDVAAGIYVVKAGNAVKKVVLK